jgi:Cof subfamily protein (haloacid dehalogenase superfamily)
MKYKMMAIDLDDTLLNDQLQISKENQEAIVKARKAGVKIVLCSGRSGIAVERYLKILELKSEEEYAIIYNGAVIMEADTGKTVFESNVQIQYAKTLFDYGKQQGLTVQTYIQNRLLVEKITPQIQKYSDVTGMIPEELGDLSKHIHQDVVKVLFNAEHERLEEVKQQLEPWVQGKLHMFFSKPFYLEFTSMDANKGIAVLQVGQRLGYTKEEIICIGDSFNDLYMIEAAGLGVAVANAHPEIKKRAGYVTQNTNEHHAVKEVIEKFIV